MIIEFSQGKLVVTPFEIQCRLNTNNIVLTAMVDDMKCLSDSLMLIADAGAVRWSLKLDNAQQFYEAIEIMGIAAE
ncbi:MULTISPECIES: DUF3389 family protein [unclassified Shewanella]|uniref:DUF3389 family protein n=1 Tax=unclassified Shewanella TaxID=196818 RepID=UPI000C859A93|nr:MULTISPECIES: DUF3389 family protein [unclassified Shewanella]MDO6618840.1 DUF3389 family protein [Shewanella sp. 6_MG-2023]MDO6640393.1 DUF3389 family protein [Shewanella sp. 5_MG-2023]MDO6775232.1 DUF3389 family protein [Shewanella sp. 3_MG-2023]PMG29683.1 PTS sugar transporter subunit IIA [Shewanella sp. 10N.286.52.C2]PMG51246.1 PTS sugar transporter subunit IIA [Shewanella sp. 10N.286.52.B9]